MCASMIRLHTIEMEPLPEGETTKITVTYENVTSESGVLNHTFEMNNSDNVKDALIFSIGGRETDDVYLEGDEAP